MTRDQIISQLFTGKSFNDCIRKMEPEHLRDDLKMEVMTVICELPQTSLFDLYNRGKLEHYTTRVIINMIINKYSPFFKKYRGQSVQYMENLYEGIDADRDEFDYRLVLQAMARQNNAILITEEDEATARREREDAEDRTLVSIGDLDWYTEGMIKLYLESGNYRAMERATGIPFPSCYKTVQKAVKQLKQKALCSTTT
jgi:hypothetical protein